MVEISLAILLAISVIVSLCFIVLYFRTKRILDLKIYEFKTLREESLNIIDEIRSDLKAGRVLLKIDRLDTTGLLYRR